MLPPALTSAAAIRRASEQRDDAIDGVAFGDAAEIELDAGLVEARSSAPSGSGRTCAPPTWRRAAASSSSDGTRPSPRKNPQAFISGPTVMSNAPSDRGVAHRLRDEVEQLRFDRDRIAAPPRD